MDRSRADRGSPRRIPLAEALRGIFWIAVALCASPPVGAQPQSPPPSGSDRWVFRGGVYESTGGESIRPIAGATVGVYGTQRPYPDTGRLLRSARTDAQGEFEIAVTSDDGSFAYYHVRQTDLPGYASAYASSRSGTARTPDWVEFDASAPERTYSDIRFWDIGARPDLLVSLSAPVIEEGGGVVRIPVQVWNSGSAASAPTEVRISSGDWSIEIGVPGLAAGAAETLVARLPITPEQRGRRHLFRAEVDPAGKVEEFNEENNQAEAVPIEIPALPDLIVVGGAAEILDEGRAVRVAVEVANRGGVAAGGTTVAVDADGWGGSADLAPLGPGLSARVEIRLEIPNDRRGGSAAFRTTADPGRRIEEMDEANNVLLLDAIALPDLPDLRIPEARVEIGSDRMHVLVSGTVENAGGVACPQTEVAIASGAWRASASIPRLDPGKRSGFEARLPIPDGRRGERATFTLRVDPESRIAERDEQNNAAQAGPIEIPDLPDLVAEDLVLELLPDRRTVRIDVQIANRGGTASAPTTVRVESNGWGGSAEIGRIEPGGRLSPEILLEIPPDRRGMEHRFRAHVDPENRVVERDEANNVFDIATRKIPHLPDLAAEVRRLRILASEDSLSIVVSVRNQGGAPAPSAILFASSAGWEQRGVIPALAAGGETEVELRFRIGDAQRGTTQRFRIELDPSDEIRELDEGNNVVETPEIEIPERKPVPAILWIGAGAAVLLVLAAIARRLLLLRRRKQWHAEAHAAAPPENPQPEERYCRRFELEVDPEGRRIAALSVAVRPSGESGTVRTVRLEGKGVASLNEVVDDLRGEGPPPGLRERLETIAEGILQAAARRPERTDQPVDLRIVARLVGGKATHEYVLYRCERKGSADLWVEESRWTARTVADAEIEIGEVRSVPRPGDDWRGPAEELAGSLERFVRKV